MDERQRTGPSFSSKRFLPLKGARNVRDLGGYIGDEGKTVKWGCLFRAGDLDLLTDSDLSYLTSLNIKTLVDFRRQAETKAAPDPHPASLTEYIGLPIDPGAIKIMAIKNESSPERLMAESYLLMVRDFQPQFARFLNILSGEEKTPLIFHCTAGKDRTGLASALLLSALGVDRKTIMADYMLSAEGLGDKYAGFIERHPQLAPLVTINQTYLQGALDFIDQQFGGMEKYLTENLRADIAQLRYLYLQ